VAHKDARYQDILEDYKLRKKNVDQH